MLSIVMVPAPSMAAVGDWDQMDDMPTIVTGFGFATLEDGRVFVSQGLTSFDIFDPDAYSDRTWLFDPSTDDWMEVSSSPDAYVYTNAVAMPDGNVYVFNGLRFDTLTVQEEVLIYTISNDSWTYGAVQPAIIFRQAAALDERRIMLIGGQNATTADVTGECHMYDITTNEFYEVDGLPNELSGGVAVNAGGSLYCIGGSDDSLVAQEEVFRYDATIDHWALYGRMPEGRYGDRAVLAGDGLVYMYGGKTGATTNSQGTGTFKVLDLRDCSFVEVPAPPMKVQGSGMTATADGRLIIFGGGNAEGISDYATSLVLFERDAWLAPSESAPGEGVRLFVSVKTYYADNEGFSATALLTREGTILAVYSIASPNGAPSSVLIIVPEDLTAGNCTVVIVDAMTGNEMSAISFDEMTLTVTDAPTPTDRIGELEDQISELQDELAGKMDAWVGYALLGISLVILVVAVLMLLRKR